MTDQLQDAGGLARRAVLAGFGAGLCALVGLRAAEARGGPGALFVSCRREGEDRYQASGIGLDGALRFDLPLPGRGHSTAFRPDRPECVVFARRPGTFAVVIDHGADVALRRIDAPENRHFYGHGAFSPDGGTLFASENDFEGKRGIVGVYDARDGYRRIGEFESHGLGPHDLRLMPDQKTLMVANGGILTHPDFDRLKLNLPDMKPTLAFVDLASGRLLDEAKLPPSLHKLSTRHLAFGADGVAAVAMQDEDDGPDLRPLVGVHRGGGIALLDLPEPDLRRMVRYTGSTAFDAGGRVLAVSAPRGNMVAFWEIGADAGADRWLGRLDLADACGVAPDGAPGGFLVTSGTGRVVRFDARARTTQDVLPPGPGAWDNHTMRLA
ncbi:MAG: DUF1513 domain-containing protein [Geminicoccaceae bacterium]|nr:DUF1513 domain-containing protein [Geminicoccaceae bacterium]